MELPRNMEPCSRLLPMHWKWTILREQLMRAGELIGVNEAGRRTIQLLNPGLYPLKSTTHTLQMSIQLVLPGEIATAHRHTMAAIRFVAEGGGTFTTVEGDSFLMEPGDLIRGRGKTVVNNVVLKWERGDCFVVPNWSWHWHENNSRDEDAFLFFISDRPMLEPFGLYREEYR